MTAPSQRKVIRVGDRVKIIDSKFIKRVGYPLIWTDIVDEVAKDPRTLKAWALLTKPQAPSSEPLDKITLPGALEAITTPTLPVLSLVHAEPNIPPDFLKAVAKQRVREMNFGGSERQLIYLKTRVDKTGLFWSSDNECADYTGQIFEVHAKKVVKTGTYRPARGGRGSFWDEHDEYDPAGLDDCKTHVLLQTHGGWIEDVSVELYKRAPGSSDKYPASSKYAPGKKSNRKTS